MGGGEVAEGGVGGDDGTNNWILETLTHTLAKISDVVSSSEADARSLGVRLPCLPSPRGLHPHLELQLGPPLGPFPEEGAGRSR